MGKILQTRILTKRDALANWTAANPLLLNGEEVLVDLPNNGGIRRKIGDGESLFSSLPYSDEDIYTEINNSLQSAKDYADSLLGGETYKDVYSNSESVSGQWVDGRPIYRTVLTFTSPTMSKQWVRRNFTTAEQSSMNIDFYLNVRGMAKCKSESATATGTWQPVPRICPDAVEEYSIGVGDLAANVVGVLFGTSYTEVEVMYLILDYVKKI